ncbi:hypothetical protein DD238_004003 [Peronospora effusa]|uniref:GOLD domain-containing protein n=1 Tax=Peronospora effusa TaxID=542832 RepID=A0A3M6VHY6_9STRA|nr:hypothetical protein DD238_004003 [Peronospora effusa]RQM17822.1 hypothetical protein DD237_002380 [Peronospora effusa]
MAADVSARVHLVAEKLQLKAQDAQRKGNNKASEALYASVSDLRQALALISEQRHLLTRRKGEGSDEEEDDADAAVQTIVTRLLRVKTTLGKKAEDMKTKGNEKAATALQQSAIAVDQGCLRLKEQQQTIFGLLGRWEKMQSVVIGEIREREVSSDGEEKEVQEKEETEERKVIARVQYLVQLGKVISEVFPDCQKVEDVQKEAERLKQEAERAREEVEEMKVEIQRVKKRETVRQEEDAALLEQQREACQAMEQLVRESDEEIHRMTKSAMTRAEEMQSLKIEMESLVVEKERLVRAHRDEIEEVQGQLASAMDALSTKMDGEKLQAEEMQILQIELDSVILEKNNLVKAHADEVDELRRQLESATASLSLTSADTAEANAEELQALLATVDTLTAEKENRVKLHVNEAQELQKAHSHEMEDLRQKFDCAMNDVSTSIEASGRESVGKVQGMQATDNLISDKEDLAKPYAEKIEALQKAHRDEVDDLRRQLESAASLLSASVEKMNGSNAKELQSLRDKVNDLTLEKEDLAKTHGNELKKLWKAHVAELEDLRHQLEATTGDRADHATKTKERPESTFDELQQIRAEVGALIIEKDRLVREHAVEIDKLLHQVKGGKAGKTSKEESSVHENECDGECVVNDDVPVMELEEDEHQPADIADEDKANTNLDDDSDSKNAMDSLNPGKDHAESQEKAELLANEETNVVDKLRRSHEEETRCLIQRLADSEGMRESLVTQLKEMKSELAAKSAEQKEAAEALMHCKAELCACHSELEAQIAECSQLKSELEAVQHAEAAKSGEIDERLSEFTTELRKVVIAVRSRDSEAMRDSKLWQSPEVTELCSGLAPLLVDLVSAQDRIHAIEEQLKLMCSERDNEKLMIDQFVKTSDWRLFAKDDEKADEVTGSLDRDLQERLSVAKINIHRWLDELQLLRDRVEKDLVKLNTLEHEKLQHQKRLVALEESEHDLQVLVESLREELEVMRTENQEAVKFAEKLKAQNHSASIQEQQQQAAQQEEVAELQQQLVTVRSDFDRYRARSHTALKKMEKRAELLNGMRKENKDLLKQVTESDRQREEAIAAREDSESRLQEVQRTQEMMQAEFEQLAMEKLCIIVKLKDQGERLAADREQMEAKIQELAIKKQELEMEKKQIVVESDRNKKAEQAAFQAQLDTATAVAIRTAKLDLQKVHDALEVSKAENDKRQRHIESLELQLEKQSRTAATFDTKTKSPVEANVVIPAPVAYVSPLASPAAKEKTNVAGLVKEVSVLKASGASLRKQLDDAQAELVALQERFATTKAANAEKVFALEEKSNHWKMELAVATEEVQRLNTVVEAQKKMVPQPLTNGTVKLATDKTKEGQTSAARMHELLEQNQSLTAELADANTEITLLTRALDDCRTELHEAQSQLEQLALLSSELESCEDSSAISKAKKALDLREEAIKKLRVQVFNMQEEMQTLRKEKTALELKVEKGELDELQACRDHIQSEKVRAMQVQRRQTLVSGFEKQVVTTVDELQQRLEQHSSAFREVCDFRDEHCSFLFSDGDGGYSNSSQAVEHADDPEFEECLVMRSGVVIKAGTSFELPVFCEKSGWRVVWSFSIKEDGADVSFKLSARTKDETSTETEVVSPERMNEMSGVLPVRHDNTTLVFEWDNTFSWLNEKTLDYHVSIQEPLTPQAQKVRRTEREHHTKAKLLEDGLALLQAEAQRRSELSDTLKRLGECEATKETHLAEFKARKTELLTQKKRFQEEMDEQKVLFSAMLEEQDELEDIERSIVNTWESAVSERQDVEMTLQLTGNGAQLEVLAHKMKEQAQFVAEQLKNPGCTAPTAETSKTSDEKVRSSYAEDKVEKSNSECETKMKNEQNAGASTALFSVSNKDVGAKRQFVEPEVIALNELLDTFPSEIDDTQVSHDQKHKRKKTQGTDAKEAAVYSHEKQQKEKKNEETEEEEEGQKGALIMSDTVLAPTSRQGLTTTGSRYTGGQTKLTDLVQRVRNLERDNLHLKQALLLGKNATGRKTSGTFVALGSLNNLGALSSLAGLRNMGARRTLKAEERVTVERLLAERTRVVTEMVEHLNAAFLSLGDASRVWHEDCRISAGVREWDAFGRLQTISLWNMIRSVFKSIVVDIVELRPHLPDGEMILTKWRIQGEIASAQHLERVCASEDCPATMRVALLAIKSSDLTFTVTTYVVFHDLLIAEQHHCWDQVGVFKRLFGGEIPLTVRNMLVIDEDTVAGRKQPLDV